MAVSLAEDDLCAFYPMRPAVFDEMCRGDGELREHWRYFVQSLGSLGLDALTKRREESRRLLKESGVTYNVHGDPDGLHRPWELDPVPLLMDSDEWAGIERGLIQRAELLNLLLADLYGPRETLRKGLIPLELVHQHRGFLRVVDGIRLPGERQLILHAADLSRSPQGEVWVLGDRTQAPSGAGYALENRMVMSRVFPSLFRDSHVHRLASFFRVLRHTLSGLAGPSDEEPRVVVLTPGPHNETYFEHAYLASYLGYTLVQGEDLTVRDGRVWMRSLDGLEPVDVILRRLDDDFCDPLELRPDSRLGVPGLVEAARRGHIAIANPLGSGVLENPGLLAFLPGLAKHFLGQELKIPSVATWWCGQAKERDYVLENLERLVIKPISRHAHHQPVFGSQLSKQQLAHWRVRIRHQGALYVGQEQVSFATAPTLTAEDLLEPRPALLRVFLAARGSDYAVMPGGLTRIAPTQEATMVSSQLGGLSKDTWVLASEPERQVTLWEQGRRKQQPNRSALPSSAAENLFWLGRYAERGEATVRALRHTIQAQNDFLESEGAAEREHVHALLRSLTHITFAYPGFVGDGAETRLLQPEQELLALTQDQQRPGSVAFTLSALINAAYCVRDRLSSDTWRVVNGIEEQLQMLTRRAGESASLQDRLDRIVTLLMAMVGLSHESMTRMSGWRFLDLGRRLERGKLLCAFLRATLVPVRDNEIEALLMDSVLSVLESKISYRRVYHSYLRMDGVLGMLVCDAGNPRALAFQMDALSRQLDHLPHQLRQHPLSREQRILLKADTQLRLAEANTLAIASEKAALRTDLDQLLGDMDKALAQFGQSLTETYFAHAHPPQQLVPAPAESELAEVEV